MHRTVIAAKKMTSQMAAVHAISPIPDMIAT
jgi:hypothetical protein